MSERHGLWSPLSSSFVYESFHHLIGARRWLKRFAHQLIRPRNSDRVLDIGCGPGALLRYLPPTTTYIGLDRNRDYIERARRTFGSRGEFICDDVANIAEHGVAPVNIAVAIGLLHHLDDDLAASLIRTTAGTLVPGGRLITVDPCYHPEQSAIQRMIVSNDRGMHVRPFERYAVLCSTMFPDPQAAFERAHFPFPYSVCILQMVRRPA
jgi:SAM-dependent methyltransferase